MSDPKVNLAVAQFCKASDKLTAIFEDSEDDLTASQKKALLAAAENILSVVRRSA